MITQETSMNEPIPNDALRRSAGLNDLAIAPAAKPAHAERFCEAEWQARVELAACYRLFAHLKITDLIYTHISSRVPGHHDQFLINAHGMLFEEITASSLVKVDVDGQVLDDITGLGINPGGFTIHSAVHSARPDVGCVMHTHTADGITVSCQQAGLLPLNQHSMRFTDRIAYHDYMGVHFTDEERQSLQRSLGDKQVMLLRNHGLLVAGPTVPHSFDLMYYLERACQLQVRLQSTGAPIIHPAREVALQVARSFERPSRQSVTKAWTALIRMLERQDPSYRS
jgi:ribulose-5-phosphate 4-epimerase/fuculose-1-phosphate aldolase